MPTVWSACMSGVPALAAPRGVITETPAILAFRNEMAARAARGEPPLVRNEIAMGEGDFPVRARNMQKGSAEGSIVEHIIVAEKV